MTINVHEHSPQIEEYRDKYIEIGVWHYVNPETGELFKRYDFADILDTCLHRMRPWWQKQKWPIVQEQHGYCLLEKGHRGRHATVVFYCDACGKARRGTPSVIDHDGGVAFCFMCCGLPNKRGWHE